MFTQGKSLFARFAVVTLALACGVSVCGQASPDRAQEIEMHAARARQALEEREPDLAEHEYQAILSLDPGNADARGNLGVVAYLQGDCQEARVQFIQALELQPALWKVQAMLGLCEKYLGQTGKAKERLEESFPHLTEQRLQVRAGLGLAEIYYQQGELEKTLPILNVLEQADPKNADVLYVEYRIHTDLADQARDKLGLVAPDSARMHQVLAEHLINEGDATHAVQQYREALRIEPHLPGGHFELAEALLQESAAGEEQLREEARKEFEVALQSNPRDEKAEVLLAGIYYLQGDVGSSLEHYSRAADLDPEDAQAQIGLGRILTLKDQSAEAVSHLQKAVELDPLNAIAHYRLSQVYRKLGRDDEARQEMEAFKKLKEAKDRLRELYSGAYKNPEKQDVFNADVPR